MQKKVLLMILDGWGIGKLDKTDAIFSTETPNIDLLTKQYPHAQLLTSGENVGLPDGQMGNSEVGHLNIGAGRVVYQDLVKINKACKDNTITTNPEVVKAFTYAKANGKKVHLMGLVSDGGVHSSMQHLFKLCDVSKHYGIAQTFIHCFMDGRDTDPRSGAGFLKQLATHCQQSTGVIASVIGRYYAMDRDKRWERVSDAYQLLVNGVGQHSTDLLASVEQSYKDNLTDEFIKPLVAVDANDRPVGTIGEGDVVIFFNYRNDRARELTDVLTQNDKPEFGMKALNLYYCTMTPYDDKFKGMHILYDKENVKNTIGEVLANAGKKQLRIAETEKYAHVTFFFSGGREKEFDGESRILVSSPKVATYDLQPEMGAHEIKDNLIAELNKKELDFIALNFANGDMVGHTGVYSAIQQAVRTVDQCAYEVVQAAQRNGYSVIIIADHGNADNAVNPDGSANTAHSLNPVPIIVVDQDIKTVQNGILADVAPTILWMMGVKAATEMDGKVLVK